jgi:glycosyltransferase involved in cell wall biosynthesis
MARAIISICICTYNRSKSLWRTLDSLAKLNDIDSTAVEVLIVDKNCSDGTADVVEAFREKLPIRRVTESCPGLARARNKAVAEFRGDVLLFTDDDITVASGWLAAYEDAIHHFPDADYFGGRILPDWDGAKPRWIKNEPLALIDGALVWFDHGVETRLFGEAEPPPFGASFAIRRSLFEKVGLFCVDLGASGVGLRGEETEFLTRARNIGAQGVYVGQAVCFHTYDARRFTLSALWRYGIACGRTENAIANRRYDGSWASAVWFLVKGCFQLLKGRGDRFRQCIINAGIQAGTRRPGTSSQ